MRGTFIAVCFAYRALLYFKLFGLDFIDHVFCCVMVFYDSLLHNSKKQHHTIKYTIKPTSTNITTGLLFGPLRPPSRPLKLGLALWSQKLAHHPQTDLKRPKTDLLGPHTGPWYFSLAFRALSQRACLILSNLCFSESSWSLWRSEIASQTSWMDLKSFKQTPKNIRPKTGSQMLKGSPHESPNKLLETSLKPSVAFKCLKDP